MHRNIHAHRHLHTLIHIHSQWVFMEQYCSSLPGLCIWVIYSGCKRVYVCLCVCVCVCMCTPTKLWVPGSRSGSMFRVPEHCSISAKKPWELADMETDGQPHLTVIKQNGGRLDLHLSQSMWRGGRWSLRISIPRDPWRGHRVLPVELVIYIKGKGAWEVFFFLSGSFYQEDSDVCQFV